MGRHALVIGAGLAGAALCATLARRGWSVHLIDGASGPARGASALPVGMLSPHVTRAPTPLSRLSDLGVHDMRAQLERLVPQGAGWQSCEVDNLGHNPGRWPAALVQPAAVVRAWLDEAAGLMALQTHWGTPVHRLERVSHQWQAIGADGRLLTQAPVAVVAAAHESHALLVRSLDLDGATLPLRPVQGQLSYAALTAEALMPRPQRNNGVFVPAYEDSSLPPAAPARLWAMGSTYERGKTHCHPTQDAHTRNLESLEALCAPAAQRMREDAAGGQLMGWAQVRCASLDRLPLMGALPRMDALEALAMEERPRRSRLPLAAVPRWPGLYALTALGSRGLTLSHWCAHQLACQIDGEGPDVQTRDLDLISALDPARFAWKALRRPASDRPAAAVSGG